MTPGQRGILIQFDQGLTPVEIAASGVALPRIYATLRKWRPRRERAARRRTSQKRGLVLALAKEGVGAARIVVLVRISRARVYKILAERPPESR
jgi:hypothetical protein